MVQCVKRSDSKISPFGQDGDFPIKYGQTNQKHPWSIFLKTLGDFKIIVLKCSDYFFFCCN